MADTKEFESLDELFRKTFDNLPETPAQSGWDAPSERVWQHVQSQIKPPRSGWSAQTISLIAAFAVTLVVGLYLFLNQPEKTETPVATPPPAAAVKETVEPPAANIVATTDEPAPQETASLPAKSLKGKSGATVASPVTEQSEAAKTVQDDSSEGADLKPDDKKPVPPNTTERRKAELAKRAEAAWKTPLQSLPQRWPKEVKITD